MTVDEAQELVEEIQRVLAAAADPGEEELMDLADRHDELVSEVTRRLRAVEKLLNKGLRSEAVELAEQEPNLNDLVTALDFAELPAWNDFLIQFEIEAVRDLPVDIAAELNDAYSLSAPVERLLQRFRTQSLARAPLADRIETLRRLAVEDAASGIWQTDLRTFETHRVGDLKRELQAAVKSRDLETIARLDQELASADWVVTIPPELKKTARDTHRKLRQHSARTDLEPLSYQLSEAYAEFDLNRARSLEQRFLALADIVNLPETDPIYDIAGPALDWLADEEARSRAEAEYQEGLRLLESALDRKTTLEELERLYNQTIRHGQNLPERLENRLADRIDHLKTADSRRRVLLLTSLSAGCLVCIVAVFLIVRRVTFSQAVASHQQQLAGLLQKAQAGGDLSLVDDYLAAMNAEDSRFQAEPEIAGLREQLKAARTQEESRQKQLNQLLGEALSLGTSQPQWDDFSRCDELLKQAEQVVLNESENVRLLQIRTDIQQARDQLQQETDTAFEQDQAQVVEMIATLPRDSLNGYAAVTSRLAELENRRNISSELKVALRALIVKVDEQKSLVSDYIRTAQSLRQITQSCGQPDAYRQALIDYGRDFPETVRAQELLQIANSDAALWQGVESWNRLRQQLLNLSPSSTSAAAAASFVQQYDQFLKSSGPYPGRTEVSEQLAALRAVANRTDSASGSTIDQIDRMFAPRTVSQAGLVVTEKDGRFFTRGTPSLTGSLLEFDYFTTTTGTQTENKRIYHARVIGATDRREAEWLAPQTVMSQQLLPALKQQIQTDYEAGLAFGVEQLQSAVDVDSILRLLLVEKLLLLGSEGSLFIKRRAAPHLDRIARSGVSKLTNWVAPLDKRADEERSQAEAFFSRYGDELKNDLQAAVEDREKAADLRPGPAMQWVGWLHRDTNSEWVISLPDELSVSRQTELLALGRKPGRQDPDFIKVATVSENALVSVPVPIANDLQQGCPVYMEVPGD